MTLLLLALACSPDPPATAGPPSPTADTSRPPPDLEPVRVVLDDALRIGPPPDGQLWGWALTAGCDLDHDGVLEWAATDYRGYENGSASVQVYEGTDHVATRGPYDNTEPIRDEWVLSFGEFIEAGGDADGDGFPDLLISDHRLINPSRTHVVVSTDPADDKRIFDAEPNGARGPLAFLPTTDSGWAIAIGSDPMDSHYRLDALPVDDLVATELTMTAAHRVLEVFVEDGPPGVFHGPQPLGPASDRTPDRFVLTRTGMDGGWIWDCPLAIGIDPSLDCHLRAQRPLDAHQDTIGAAVATADLDRDGTLETITLHHSGPEQDASTFYVYEADGTLRATVRGAFGFGTYPVVVTDDRGDPWVVVTNGTGYQAATVYAFHPTQLYGDVADTDALRQYTTGRPGRLQFPTPYRATPDSPLQILATDPYLDGGVVYLFDW